MALALAWSRSLADAHDVADASVTSGNSGNELTPFVLCSDDEYMSLLDSEASPSSPSSPPTRPVWSENELDRHLGDIRMQLVDQEGNRKNGKVHLQGMPLWTASKADRLVESIRQATEALVWGERHDAALFDLFCEHHLLAAFIEALRTVIPIQVKVQILQTISILIQNARRTTSFFFLLSGGLLNNLFDDPPELDEEEILTYFVTFLKSLALRLDAASARLCLKARATHTSPSLQRLPIFECAVKLIGHRDSMVQTAARTALLSLLRIDDLLLREVTGEATVQSLAPCLANIVSASYIFVQVPESPVSDASDSRLQDAYEDLEDWLRFVTDLFVLEIPEVTKALAQVGFRLSEDGATELSDVSQGVRMGDDSSLEQAAGETTRVHADTQVAPDRKKRLQSVLQHYRDKEGLPFPHQLDCQENIAAIISNVTSSLTPQREVRRAVTFTILDMFPAEELCLDLATKDGAESLAVLEKGLAAAFYPHARNPIAINMLKTTVSAWHSVSQQASAEDRQAKLVSPQEEIIKSTSLDGKNRGKRYHVYTYTLMGDDPYEKLATDSFKKATTSLHYNTLMGRTAIMYDQCTGRSTFKREKRGNPYIVRAIRAAHTDNPCHDAGNCSLEPLVQ